MALRSPLPSGAEVTAVRARAVLDDAGHAVEAYKAVEPLRVDPLNQLAVVRVQRDLSLHEDTPAIVLRV